MAFTTKVITDTSPDFGDNPQTITESGQPASVEVDGLVSNTGYWTKAEIWQNGVLNDTSEVETFTTLPAGTITLEHISTTRSGYGYDVAYRYTSTYAPTSAILSTNSTQFQGVIDSAQHAVSFWVTGLTAGTAYLTNVTMYDIYAESVTVMGSIVTTVVNEVRITNTTPSETSVECELDYVIDGGFTTGWVDYWLGVDDPTQTQPQGHFYFNDGDDTCTASGLTAGTAYYFRATIVLGDGTTEIHSSVVGASTVDDTDYFYVENTENTESFYIRKVGTPTTGSNLEYSVDKNTWLTPQYTNSFAYIPVQGTTKIYFRSSTGFSQSSSSSYNIGTYRGESFRAGGNILSVVDYTNIDNISTIPDYGFYYMFGGTGITEADIFGEVVTIGDHSCYGMFANSKITNVGNPQKIKTVRNYGCSNMFKYSDLVNPLNLNTVTTAYPYAFQAMYNGCDSLLTASNLNSLREINPYTCSMMYYGCTSLINPPEMNNVTVIRNDGLGKTFGMCSSLVSGVYLKNVTSVDFNSGTTDAGIMGQCYTGCTSLKTAYAPNISNLNQNNNMVLKGWLTNVLTGGTAYKKRDASFLSGADGLPSGWTSQDY